MKKKFHLFWKVCAVALVLCGLVVSCSPLIYSAWSDAQMRQEIEAFQEQIGEVAPPELSLDEQENTGEAPPKDHYIKVYDTMIAYNALLWVGRQKNLMSEESVANPPPSIAAVWDVDKPIGYLSVPKLGVELPLYLGASTEHLSKGAAVLGQTSMPIGGENSNCVISAHRGYKGAAFLRDIEKLEVGDEITMTTLWETLTYRVSETEIVAPDDVQSILIQPNRDLVTLLTCHPYRSGGKYRYLVYCERVN